ncbi:VOC family protein [Streptomyces sp. N2-109]|uniref:VOC family protein n=1 Tax=Streptomyces gossypii TaxID=2883101 RepID=A0ABT2JW90_9ACTN|nr:VOC family protein [Streptomyces gossypii]MCT2592145.1 VOC family protein [Streptomyces gossypii]
MPALAEFTAVVIDCADPAVLADFYRKATGWEILYSDQDFASLGNGGPVQVAFQRIEGYQAPGWPDGRKHAHLDLTVTDLARTAKELLAIGAAKPEFQPGGGEWVVLTDPEGHPFCLTSGS